MTDTWTLDLSRYEGHTPGPWEENADGREGMEWNIEIIQSANPYMRVAFMANFGDDSEERSEPTACLIADAPHLLALVQTLTAERDRLRKALEPLADELSDAEEAWETEFEGGFAVAVDLLRDARAALTEGEGNA